MSAIKRTFTHASINSSSSSKLFSSLSGKLKGQSGIGGSGSSTEIVLRSNAPVLHYLDKDVENKLKLLVSSRDKFDEVLELGFPAELSTEELAQIGVSTKPVGKLDEEEQEEEDPDADSMTFTFPPRSSLPQQKRPSATQLRKPESLEQIRESTDASLDPVEQPQPPQQKQQQQRHRQSGSWSTSRTITTPVSTTPRELTLKITLTPSSMRATEEVIYGWQKTETPSTATAASTPTTASVSPTDCDGYDGLVNATEDVTLTGVPGGTSSAIPVGGLGTDHRSASSAGSGGSGSSKARVKRVLSKLVRKERKLSVSSSSSGLGLGAGGSVMITSSDIHRRSSVSSSTGSRSSSTGLGQASGGEAKMQARQSIPPREEDEEDEYEVQEEWEEEASPRLT